MYIYFLKNNDSVVYVGRTNDVKRRLSEHKDKEFDDYSYIKCEESVASRLEDYYIMMHDPIYNRSLNSKGEYRNLGEFCEENNFDITKVKKICAEIPYIRPYFNDNYNPYELNALKEIYSSWKE